MNFFLTILINYYNVFIIVTFVILLIVEVSSIVLDKKFNLVTVAIDFCQKKQSDRILRKENKELFSWLTKHLQGDIVNEGIKPKKDSNNHYILSTYPSVLNQSIPPSLVSFAPTLLTALGILGTFLGIVSGLQNIGINSIGDTADLLKSSQELLEGMKTAFSSSLAGLGCASLMMIFLAITSSFKRKQRNNLRQKLNNIAYVESPQVLLSRFDNSPMITVSENLANLSNNLGFLANLTPDNIADAVRRALVVEKVAIMEELQSQNNHLAHLTPANIANAINPLILPLQQELINLRENQQQQQSTIQLLVRELRQELIEPVVQRLDQSAKLTEDASLAVRELKNELGGIAESLTGAVNTIQEFQQDTLVKLREFAESLQGILTQFRDDTQGILQQMAGEINRGVAESIQGMEAQRQAFESSALTASQTFRGIRQELETALVTQGNQQREMLQGVKEATESILQKTAVTFSQQTETLTTVGEEASKLLNQAKENLLETLLNIDSILDQTRVTLQEELETFRVEYQDSLSRFFVDQNSLLAETLSAQKDGLQEVIKNLQVTFIQEIDAKQQLNQEIKESLAKIQETNHIVSDLVAVVGLNSSERFAQLQELANVMGNEAQKLESLYGKMYNHFDDNFTKINTNFEVTISQVIAELNQMYSNTNEQINQYLLHANDTYNTSYQDADRALANICQQLNNSSHGLMNVAEYLVASANDLKQHNYRQ